MATSTTTPEELAQRKGYFATTYAAIQLHNKKKSTFTVALNRFSAMVTIIFVFSSYIETKTPSSFGVEPPGEKTAPRS